MEEQGKTFFERLAEFEGRRRDESSQIIGLRTGLFRSLSALSGIWRYADKDSFERRVRVRLRRQGQTADELRVGRDAHEYYVDADAFVVRKAPQAAEAFHADALAQLRRRVAEHPDERFSIDDRRFEEFVAYLLEAEGYQVELTRHTRDGGKDLVARIELPHGIVSVAVECKRYGPFRMVGVDRVRSLHSVVASGFSQGVLFTTSDYTLPAKQWADPHQRILTLKDGDDLIRLIRSRT